MISSYIDKFNNQRIEIPTHMYTYPGTSGQTLSGLYVFNPRQHATKRDLTLTKRYLQKGEFLTILHSFYLLNGLQVHLSQSITINSCTCTKIGRSVRLVTKMSTFDYFEFTMRTSLPTLPSPQIFTDNGAHSVLRQFYTLAEAQKLNLTDSNPISYIGLNGYASI